MNLARDRRPIVRLVSRKPYFHGRRGDCVQGPSGVCEGDDRLRE